MKVTKEERGWAGHFICADRCRFRRNTLLTCGDVSIVVSTVGLLMNLRDEGFDTIGVNRHYETMAFHSDPEDVRYHDIDVSRQVDFEGDWAISELDADDKANKMHDKIVTEISAELRTGNTYDNSTD